MLTGPGRANRQVEPALPSWLDQSHRPESPIGVDLGHPFAVANFGAILTSGRFRSVQIRSECEFSPLLPTRRLLERFETICRVPLPIRPEDRPSSTPSLLNPSLSPPERPAVATDFSGDLTTGALRRCQTTAATPSLSQACDATQPRAEFDTWAWFILRDPVATEAMASPISQHFSARLLLRLKATSYLSG